MIYTHTHPSLLPFLTLHIMLYKCVMLLLLQKVSLCQLTEKFSDTYRQPVSSLPAVEETFPTGTGALQQESSRPAVHVQPARIYVVEPDSVPGLDFGYLENQLITPKEFSKPHQDATGDYNSLRKELGTQTGMFHPTYVQR